MAEIVFDGLTSGSGSVIRVQIDDTVIINEGAVVYAISDALSGETSGVGIEVLARNNVITVGGMVYGETDAFFNNMPADSVTQLELSVALGGTLSSLFGGVVVSGIGSNIENAGHIVGRYGISLNGQSADSTTTIENSGSIVSTGSVADYMSGIVQNGTEKLVVNNTGLIHSALNAFNGDFGNDGVSQITNSGSMVGHILLGGGDDLYDGQRGKLVGEVHAGDGEDVVSGGTDDDILNGGTGDDELRGNAGADRLYGEHGKDRLWGGSGPDHFVFVAVGDSARNSAEQDTILDFSRKDRDKIDLSDIDARTRPEGDQAFIYIGDAAFSARAGELRSARVGTDTRVLGDVDGDGRADFSIRLDGALKLAASDFLL